LNPAKNIKVYISSQKGEKILQNNYSTNDRFLKKKIKLNSINSGEYNLVVMNGDLKRTIKLIKLANKRLFLLSKAILLP